MVQKTPDRMAVASKISAWVAGVAAMVMLGCGTAGAGDVDDLYQAQTIVTGQGDESRGLGFVACLEQVLVKVSGDPRLIGDPGVAVMAGQAGTFVADFRYRDRMAGIPVHDEQGTRDRPYDLTVRFHPAKIDAALQSLGREPWSAASRPRLAVFLGVRFGTTSYVLASDGDRGRDQRDALTEAARQFGIPMALPDEVALAEAGSSYRKLVAAEPSSLDATATKIGGDLALVGSMSLERGGARLGRRMAPCSAGQDYRWQIRGVSFDDAFRNAMAGAAQVLSGHGQRGRARGR